MEKGDKGSTMIRMGVSGWMFLLVPAYPGCPGSKAVKWSLLLLLYWCKSDKQALLAIKLARFWLVIHLFVFLFCWNLFPFLSISFPVLFSISILSQTHVKSLAHQSCLRNCTSSMKLLLAPFYCAYDEVVKSLCATDYSGFQIAGTSWQECMQGLCLCQASICSEINKGLLRWGPMRWGIQLSLWLTVLSCPSLLRKPVVCDTTTWQLFYYYWCLMTCICQRWRCHTSTFMCECVKIK